MTHGVVSWWRSRSPRERRLAGAFALALALSGGVPLARLMARDVAALRAAVADGERRLAVARGFAGRLETSLLGGGPPVVSVVEGAVVGVVGAGRLTHLQPGDDPERSAEARLVDLDLSDVVRVLAALETQAPWIRVRDLDLRERPDAPGRYDATAVVVRRDAS